MALTKVGPAGIGSTPGIGITIGNSFLHTTGLESTNANFSGIVTAQSFRVIGDFQVDGTTTTLDTEVTSVDKLEIGANNNTVGVAITQSGTGDILRLYDGSSQVVTVDDEGQIGIGANAPSANLDIAETGFVNVKVRTSGNNSATLNLQNSQRNFSVNNVTGGAFTIHDGTASAERLRITSAGLVGIGTANPTNTLEISKVDNHGITLRRPAGGTNPGTVKFEVHSNGAGRLVSERDFNINFDTDDIGNQHFSVSSNGSERLRIKSDGNVGIGTDDPDNHLHLLSTDGTVAKFESTNATSSLIRFVNASGGNVYIGA